MKRWALFSLTDKTSCESLAQEFVANGVSLLASGGTKKYLEEHGLEVTDISDFTGEPERFGGRVKTLHHKVYASMLLRANDSEDLREWPEGQQIVAVACNFYPFEEKGRASKDFDELVEWVDIGGPTMVRAAAKNHKHVWVFTDHTQYPRFLKASYAEREAQEFRQKLALEAFARVRDLDEAIVAEWSSRLSIPQVPGVQSAAWTSAPELEYGENPHQKARFELGHTPVEFSGRVSYNNVRDAEAAWRFVKEFEASKHPAVAVVKHQTLCGAAVGLDPSQSTQAFQWAWESDPVSRFGGILGFNRVPNAEVTAALLKPFVEVLVLPLSSEARAWAESYRNKKERVLTVLVGDETSDRFERWSGTLGHLEQAPDHAINDGEKIQMTTPEEFWHRCSAWMGACSKSNALAITAQDKSGNIVLIGAGQGQPNRVEAFAQLAWPRARAFMERFAEFHAENALLYSDAFLPFPDLIEEMHKAGLRRLVQPGGSKNDPKVLERARELGVQVQLTGRRHFWH
jgi:phosphoribosylaminoimidazolecarboxamide formyltransferase / IMP cyclohydrolase